MGEEIMKACEYGGGALTWQRQEHLGKERGELLNIHVPTLAPLRWSQSSPGASMDD